MSDEELRELYRRHLPERAAGPPEPEALLEALEGGGTEADRLAVFDRALASEEGHRELELLRALRDAREESDADPGSHGAPVEMAAPREVVPRPGPGQSRGRWPQRWIGLAAAATLVLAAVGVLRLGSPSEGPPDVVRSGRVGPVLVAPAAGAGVSLPASLTWTAVPGAVEYRVEVLDVRGELLAEHSGPDTTLTLRGVPAGVLRWWVRAILPTGSSLDSELRELRVR